MAAVNSNLDFVGGLKRKSGGGPQLPLCYFLKERHWVSW